MRRSLSALWTSVGLLLTVVTAGGLAASQQATKPASVDVETLGPKVGDAVPDFTLPDQRGRPHSLKSLLGPKGAVLVFFRSADW